MVEVDHPDGDGNVVSGGAVQGAWKLLDHELSLEHTAVHLRDLCGVHSERVRKLTGFLPRRDARSVIGRMADVWFVVLTAALFALVGLIVRGVERL